MKLPTVSESLAEATSLYEQSVVEAKDYLLARGITGEMAQRFRLGFVTTPMVGHEQYQGRLSIPYVTPTGVVNLRFRAVDGDGAKYLGLPGSRTNLFNVRDLGWDHDVLVVCEGELDTVIVSGGLGIPSVGVPGVSNWKPHYSRCLHDFSRVIVACDGDAPGREFGNKLAKEIDRAVVIHMPEGSDVNDVYLQEGPEGLTGRMGIRG